MKLMVNAKFYFKIRLVNKLLFKLPLLIRSRVSSQLKSLFITLLLCVLLSVEIFCSLLWTIVTATTTTPQLPSL